jgi:DMSO/TMAO reductase YedYZ molybdopterin-dependent catalytic subunit
MLFSRESGGAMSEASEQQLLKPLPPELLHDHGGNAEMRWEAMSGAGYATPNDRFYVRNHGPTPSIGVASWTLHVEGPGVSRGLSLSYEDLLALPAVSVTRALECAGNGRIFFGEQEGREEEGTPWRLGAIGVAGWTGVPLRLLLEEAGLEASAVEVMPEGLEEPGFARPLPLSKALEEDVVLAYLMNGEPLPPDHGYPARLVVPGWAAMASVKWVGRILVSDRPLLTHWNTEVYVLVGPDYAQHEGPGRGPAVKETLVNSALELPWPAQLPEEPQEITGRAWSGAGTIASVEYRIDGGEWRPADLRGPISPAPCSASPLSGKQRPESTNCGCERPTLRATSSRRACRTTSRATSTTPSSPTRLQFINRQLVHLWRPLTVRYLKR